MLQPGKRRGDGLEIVHSEDLSETTRNVHSFHARQILRVIESSRERMLLDSKTLGHVTDHALDTLPFKSLERQVIRTRGEQDTARVLDVIAGKCRRIIG